MVQFNMLIGGKLVGSNQTTDIINPANEQVAGTCPCATKDDVNAAVAAAKSAFPAWSKETLKARQAVLLKMADVIEANGAVLQELITREQGKPMSGSGMETGWAPGVLRYYGTLELTPETLQDDDAQHAQLHRRPLGVVAGIVPWNFPFLMAIYKIAPALLMGNTFVLKPSPTTPLSALRLGELLVDVVPAGVLNILSDAGDIGPLLTAHPDVDKISFTGSTATGRKIMQSASQDIKRLTLELGGNDAAIILDDADVDQIAPAIFNLAFLNSGQVCMAIKRIYVQSGIYPQMCDALAKLAKTAKVGDGLSPDTEFGPLQNKAQFDRILAALEIAKRDGVILAGGTVTRPGYFVSPTLVTDIDESSTIVSEEVFGPIRPIMSFITQEEAIERANNSPYGLGASVWSSNVDRATKIAANLTAGSVWVNQHFAVAPHIPFGGTKQSGFGREFGIEGLGEYSYAQALVVAKPAA